MINLLPPNLIRQNQRAYRERQWTVVNHLGFVLLLAAIIALLTTTLSLRSERRALEATVTKLKNQTEAREYAELNRQLTEAGTKMRLVAEDQQAPPSLLELLQLLKRHEVRGLSVSSLSYEPGADRVVTVSLRGGAATRADFLTYLAGLKTDPQLARVDSPIDNIIKDKGINFTIALTLVTATSTTATTTTP